MVNVFDHGPPQWAHGLVGHGNAPVLSEGCEPLISRQDVPLRYRVGCVASRSKLPRERLVLWHLAEMGRRLMMSVIGVPAQPVDATFILKEGWSVL